MKAALTVIPLGPGDPGLLTLQSAEALTHAGCLFLRTARHPVAAWLDQQGIAYASMDEMYDAFEDFDEMNRAIAEKLLAGCETGPAAYAVPDPAMDTSVAVLLQEARRAGVPVSVLSGVSTGDACMSACIPFAGQAGGVYTVSATDFTAGSYDPSVPVLITEVDSPLLAGEVKLKLEAFDEEDESEICFLPPSEKAGRTVRRIPLPELDRQKHYDQTAAVFVPGRDYRNRKRFVFRDLEEIMRRLRAQDGCPWDRKQTHESLRPYLVEEAWEAVDAIDGEDPDHLSDELGDVLLQVVFHASIAESFDEFTMTDVLTHICRKMITRHPQLFAGASVLPSGSEDLSSVRDWEKIKRTETGSKTVGESLGDVSSSLPSLKYAAKIQKKLEQLPGFRRTPEETAGEIQGLAGRLYDGQTLNEEAMGRLLISCMELCRLFGADGEILLHGAVTRMKQQWQEAEAAALRDGKNPESLTCQDLRSYMTKSQKG